MRARSRVIATRVLGAHEPARRRLRDVALTAHLLTEADRRRLVVGDVVQHVALRDAAFAPRARDRTGIEIVLLDELADRRAHAVRRSRAACRLGRVAGATGRRRRSSGLRRRTGAGAECGRAAGALAAGRGLRGGGLGPRRAAPPRLRRARASRAADRSSPPRRRPRRSASDHAVDRRRHLEHDLVGLEIDEILVPADGLAGLLVPGDERRIGDGLGQLRNFDLDAHGRLPLAALGVDSRRVCLRWTTPRARGSTTIARPRPALAAGGRATRGCPTPAPPRQAGPRRTTPAESDSGS